jgi:hypothetical protein
VTNGLAQQTSSFWSNQGKLYVLKKLDVPIYHSGCSSLLQIHTAEICSTQPSLAKPDVPESEIGGSGISRSSNNLDKTMIVESDLIHYLDNLSHVTDIKVRRQVLKYVLLDHDLYHRTIYTLLLRSLGSDQSKIALGEVHEGICGTHQSTHQMKWLHRRAGFYWPTMLNGCFWYYQGYESCQKIEDVQLAPAAMLHPIIKPW